VTVGGEARFPFRARWTTAALAAGLSLAEIREIHFVLLLQIVGCHAQAKGAKLEWADLVASERETLRTTLDSLKEPPCPHPDLKLKLGSTLPPPSEGWPILDDPPGD